MFTYSRIKILVLFGCILVFVVGENCPFKVCECKRELITCDELGLTMIPPLTGEKIGSMHLSMETNNITQILAGSLPPNLLQIDLFRNPILTIDDFAFNDSQNTLESLSFSGAQFTRIPDALLHLQVLKSLMVYDTWIQDWNEGVMTHISLTSQEMYLVNVSFHAWPTWLSQFSHLVELSLESNYISVVPDNALDMVADTLQILILRSNNLTTIPKTVANLKALHTLLLDNNRLSYTKWLPLSSKLVTLSLTNTQLVDAQSLSNDLQSFADTLNDIDLDFNSLSEIPDLSFMPNIDDLDFSHNQISNPLAGSLHPSVTSLTLDYNFLPTIPRVFVDLLYIQNIQMTNNVVQQLVGQDIPIWIKYVDLSSNLIAELTEACFPFNSSITLLTLVSNPIVRISQDAFKNIQQLMDLNLQNTKLTRLPLAVGLLNGLMYFNVDDIPSLICTCQEKSLADWVLSRETSIDSSCGVSSVSFFFKYLSPTCP